MIKSRIVMAPALVFFFKITLAIQGLLWFHTNFRIACSSFEKHAGAILIGIALNVSIALGSIDILSIFVLPIHEHGMFFHFFPFSFSLFNFFHRRSVVFSFNFVNVYFWERERERERASERVPEQGRGREKRETQNLKQAPGSNLSAQNPMWGSNPQTGESWPEVMSVLNRVSHPGTPLLFSVYWSFTSLVRLIPRYFMVFSAIVNEINSLISLSAASLLAYRNAIQFCILILYAEAFLNSCRSPCSFLVESCGFSTESITSARSESLTPPCQFGHLVFFLFSDCWG